MNAYTEAMDATEPHLLVVDDDARLRDLLRRYLTDQGFRVTTAGDAAEARRKLDGIAFDLLVLDVMMPGEDGFQLTASLRAASRIPILLLTAKAESADRVDGLERGADDYLTKPFDLDELLARIRALLRRSQGRAEPLLRHGRVSLDAARREVRVDDKPVLLSAKEFTLLQVLIARPGVVLTREQLQEALYGWNDEIESNTIEVYVHGLRRKLGSDYIQTLRGVGYRLAAT